MVEGALARAAAASDEPPDKKANIIKALETAAQEIRAAFGFIHAEVPTMDKVAVPPSETVDGDIKAALKELNAAATIFGGHRLKAIKALDESLQILGISTISSEPKNPKMTESEAEASQAGKEIKPDESTRALGFDALPKRAKVDSTPPAEMERMLKRGASVQQALEPMTIKNDGSPTMTEVDNPHTSKDDAPPPALDQRQSTINLDIIKRSRIAP